MALAVIGGSGALDLFDAAGPAAIVESLPWGQPSHAPVPIRLGKVQAWFLARHGNPHHIPPHRVNYRANIATLKALGVTNILALNAVGGIAPELAAGDLVLPDQLVDYTWGRSHSFSDDAESPLQHVEFARPFAGLSFDALQRAARVVGRQVHVGGCHAVAQGPRLETAAEIRRMAADGCTIVGMTAMPEAALAREAALDYASLCIVANRAANENETPIEEAEIHRILGMAMTDVKQVIEAWALELEDQA